MAKSRTYFAATKRSDIGAALVKKLEEISNQDAVGRTNLDECETAYLNYYGKENGYGLTYAVTRSGTKGELSAIRVNRSRALLNAWVALITAPKISWRPQARTEGSGTLEATAKAIQFLEDFWKTRGLELHDRKMVEGAGAFSFVVSFPEWDMNAGPPKATVGDKLLKAGDITLRLLLPWDVRFETDRKSWDELDSCFACVYKNRFDLAAQASILGLADGRTGDEAEEAVLMASEEDKGSLAPSQRSRDEKSDLVPVWYFFHKESASLAYGRETQFINGSTVLVDRSLRQVYGGDMPLVRMAASDMFDSPNAWTSFWDTLGPQEMLDAVDTNLSTIITSLGQPCVAYEQGSQTRPDNVGGGFRTWSYKPGSKPPTPVELAQFPPDALKYKADLKDDQRQLMGLNDVALGQPETAQMNAQAFVVLASMAQQQASPIQTARNNAMSKLGSLILKIVRKNVTEQRTIRVESKSASDTLYQQVRYTGEDFEELDGTLAVIGNPLEQMPGGKLALLEQYRASGTPLSPDQITQVIETGRLEPAVRGALEEAQHLTYERDQLMKGNSPPVLPLDDNAKHFRENGAVEFSPAARRDPKILKAVETHLDEHYMNEYGVPRQQDPMRKVREAYLMGRAPNPTLQMGMPGTPPGAPGAPPPGGGPPPPGPNGPPHPPGPGPGPGSATQVLAPDAPASAGLPPQPTNPMTGAPFDPAGGMPA